MKYPHTSESAYSELFGSYLDLITGEFLRETRKAFASAGIVQNSIGYNAEYYLRRQNASPKDIREKILKIRENMPGKDLLSKITKSMENIFISVSNQIVRDIVKSYKRVAKIRKREIAENEIPFMALQADSVKLQEAIETNVALIGAIAEKHAENLESVVMETLQGGSNREGIVDEILSQINDTGKSARSYAEFVARDQTSKAVASINQEKQESAGIPGFIWITTNQSNTRKSHREHHLKFYRWDDLPLIDFSLDGSKRPPETLAPGEDYECHCIAVPAFSEDDVELMSGRIAARNYS